MLEQLVQGVDIRSFIEAAISEFHEYGPISPATLEKLSLIKKYHNSVFEEYEGKLLSSMGLFYKLSEPKSFMEAIYRDLSDTIQDQYGRSFTPMQASAYKAISENHFYSFSAPTSTGKSHLFRELIKEYENDIVIVVPSRALIAEFYSTVLGLVEKDVLVLQFVENINQHNTSRRVFIITPERGVEIFKYADVFDVGLFLFDEAQISEEPVRGITFDAFVRRAEKVFPNAKKVFAHPFVANPEAQFSKHGFRENLKSSSFTQSNVGKIYVAREEGGAYSYISPYSEGQDFAVGYDLIENTLLRGGTALIYISKSKIFSGGHIEDFGNYIELCPLIEDESALRVIETLESYIGASNTQLGKKSSFIQLMNRGVVVHHGSMPLKARLLIEHFVREGYAKLCFATSTLNQGINMPFDCVLIDNFHNVRALTLKNLIGRSGRSSKRHQFDYGYTIVNRRNVATFTSRIQQEVNLTVESKLDGERTDIPDDYKDIVEAIKTDSFNDDLHLTNEQVSRIQASNIKSDIRYVLDKLIDGDKTITGSQYYELGSGIRSGVKEKLKKIYCAHLNKEKLSVPEQGILSAAIPLLLWKIQGKSFSETLSLRHSYLTERDKRRDLSRQLREGKIGQSEFNERLGQIKIKFSPQAEKLPNSNLSASIPLYRNGEKVTNFDYDLLVYDTYDYLDKVISLSLADPLAAALTLYYEQNRDDRAIILKNYIHYGTNDEVEVWLLRYGFDAEDIEWIADLVTHIDENGIVFNNNLKKLSEEKIFIISRYI